MIEGVEIIPKKQIIDDRGKVMHMMRNDDKNFKTFGEIYFSYSKANTIKAWSLNKRMTKNYVCIIGEIKLVLFDDRKKSSTKGKIQEIFLSNKDYNLISIPPCIWAGFQTIKNNFSVLANCSDIPHDPSDVEKKNYDDPYFNYDWKKKII